MRKIFFVHQQKAHLPEMNAYANFFTAHGYDPECVTYEDLLRVDRKVLKESILWYFMGFYPRYIQAYAIIHDYRSLSTGYLVHFKDFLKRMLNHKPHLRVFLNDKVRRVFNFQDNIPYLLIDMGLPGGIRDYVDLVINPQYDFVYVGAVTRDREIDKVIHSFLNTYGEQKTLLLVGAYENCLRTRFGGKKNVIFYGCVDQGKVFELIKSSRYALCVIPNKYPYNLQTPTKLLEYLALKAKIIANDNPMVMELLGKTGNLPKVFIMDSYYRFPMVAELEQLQPTFINIEEYLWDGILTRSGIIEFLRRSGK